MTHLSLPYLYYRGNDTPFPPLPVLPCYWHTFPRLTCTIVVLTHLSLPYLYYRGNDTFPSLTCTTVLITHLSLPYLYYRGNDTPFPVLPEPLWWWSESPQRRLSPVGPFRFPCEQIWLAPWTTAVVFRVWQNLPHVPVVTDDYKNLIK